MPVIQNNRFEPEIVKRVVNEQIALRSNLTNSLEEHGAGIDNIARTVGNILQYGENDNSRLAAAKFAAELHGIGRELDEDRSTKIVFLVKGENVNINEAFLPRK